MIFFFRSPIPILVAFFVSSTSLFAASNPPRSPFLSQIAELNWEGRTLTAVLIEPQWAENVSGNAVLPTQAEFRVAEKMVEDAEKHLFQIYAERYP